MGAAEGFKFMFVGDAGIEPPSDCMLAELGQKEIGKKLDAFDKTPISKKLEKFLSSDPACIKLFQIIAKKHGFVFTEDAVNYFNEQYNEQASPAPFVIARKCNGCNALVDYVSLAELDFDKSKIRDATCGKCRRSCRVSQTKYKKFQNADILSLFMYGQRLNVFRPFQYPRCYFCKTEENIDRTKKEHTQLLCKKCSKPLEISLCFETNQNISKPLGIADAQGYWFDWYFGRLLKNKFGDATVVRNPQFRFDKNDFELDILLKKDDKTIGFSLSTEKDGSFDQEKFFLFKRVCDKLFLVTSDNTVKKTIIECAKGCFGKTKVSVITLSDFCNITRRFEQVPKQ